MGDRSMEQTNVGWFLKCHIRIVRGRPAAVELRSTGQPGRLSLRESCGQRHSLICYRLANEIFVAIEFRD
jgi:hypothetical protein